MNDGDTSPVVWIPRPIDDAIDLSAEVSALGLTPLVEPVMTINYNNTVPDLTGVTGLVFTSANGVRAFVRAAPDRHIPVYAVGLQCAEAARAAGFSTVVTAGGDVEKLAATIANDRSPEDDILLHAAASDRAGDLSGLLERQGFDVRRAVLYRADTIDKLPDSLIRRLESGGVAAVMLFSPRTAETVGRLLKNAGSDSAGIHAICFSQAVADKLSPQDWSAIAVAREPSRPSILQALNAVLPADTARSTESTAETVGDAKNRQKDGTEAPGTLTLSLDGSRTRDGSTLVNEKPEGASDIMNAEHVIEQFGGIRPMAQKLGIAVSTVQGWKTRNHIPENRWEDVRAAAASSGIDLDETHRIDETADTAEEPEQEAEGPWSDDQTDKPADSDDHDIASDKHETDTTETDTPSERPADEHHGDEHQADEPRPAASPPAAPPQAKATRSGSGGWALFLALIALAGIATRGYWGPAIDPKVEAHLTNFFGPPVKQQATAVDETIQTDLVRTQEVMATILQRLDTIEQGVGLTEGSEGDGNISSVALDAVKDRLAALESQLETAVTVSKDGNVDLAALQSALTALRTRMQALDEKADASIRTSRLDIDTFRDQLTAITNDLETANTYIKSLGERLLLLENTPGNPAISSAALVLAIGQLETIADTGTPFNDTLPGLRELAGDDAEILAIVDSLKEASWNGVTTLSVLAGRFDKIAATVDAAETATTDGDWIDESLAQLQSVVSIRRTDAAPDAPAATKAEAALARGDLAAAIDLVAPFRNADDEIAAWLDAAEARLAVDTAISSLRAHAVARLRALANDRKN
ncbi:MAG: uroporphyrinogen-III synthase [Alphaproteobacteria bacterium]